MSLPDPTDAATTHRNRRYLIAVIGVLLAGAILALIAYHITANLTAGTSLPNGPTVDKIATQEIHGTVINKLILPAHTETACASPMLGACGEIHVPRQYLLRVRSDNNRVTQWQLAAANTYAATRTGQHI